MAPAAAEEQIGGGIMRMASSRERWALIRLWLGIFCLCPAVILASPPVLFNRDIRPILSDTCFPCHGFDASKRKADLRLDTSEGAFGIHKGHQALKAGDLQGSELWRRINSFDPKTIMPPPNSGKKLKAEQIQLLRQWILSGAVYPKHWAFEAPIRPEPPVVKAEEWPHNDIDRFILAELEQKHIEPAPRASKETLIRRATLHLTGLPPTLQEVDAFLADHQPDAYERLVDKLLQSPHY